MIYVTGDCHGNFARFEQKHFSEQANMTKDDAVIIAGDFGGVWFGDNCDNKALGRLTAKLPLRLFGSNTTTAQLMLGISCCGSRLQKSHENKSATEKKAYMLFFRCCFREEKCTKHKVYSTPSRKP